MEVMPSLSPCTSSQQTCTGNPGAGPPGQGRALRRGELRRPPRQMAFATDTPGCAFISVPFVFCQNISLRNFTQGETGV